MEERDYYALLGVSETATMEEIKSQYFRHTLSMHPDKVPKQYRQDATECVAEINTAYEILSDPRKRKIYDIYGVKGIESFTQLVNHYGLDDEKDDFDDIVYSVREFQVNNWANLRNSEVDAEQQFVIWIDSTDTLKITQLGLGQYYSMNLTEKSKLSLGNKIEMTKDLDSADGAFGFNYQYKHSDYTTYSVECLQSLYDPDALSLEVGVKRKMSSSSSIKESLFFQRDKTVELGLEFDSQLYMFNKYFQGSMTWGFGNSPSVSSSISYNPSEKKDAGFAFSTFINKETVRYASVIYKELNDKYTLVFRTLFAPEEWNLKFNAFRQFSYLGRVGFGVHYSNYGISLNFGVGSQNRYLTIPLKLFDFCSIDTFVTSTILTFFIALLGTKMIIDPLENKYEKHQKSKKNLF
jgi:curved DNA-binding protein CbpA